MNRKTKEITFFVFAAVSAASAVILAWFFFDTAKLVNEGVAVANQIQQYKQRAYNCSPQTLLQRIKASTKGVEDEIIRLKEVLALSVPGALGGEADTNKGLRFMEALSKQQEEISSQYPGCSANMPDNWGFPRQMPEGQDLAQYFFLLDTEAAVIKKVCSTEGSTIENLLVKLPGPEQAASLELDVRTADFGVFFTLLNELPFVKTPMFYLSQIVATYSDEEGFSLNARYVPNEFFISEHTDTKTEDKKADNKNKGRK